MPSELEGFGLASPNPKPPPPPPQSGGRPGGMVSPQSIAMNVSHSRDELSRHRTTTTSKWSRECTGRALPRNLEQEDLLHVVAASAPRWQQPLDDLELHTIQSVATTAPSIDVRRPLDLQQLQALQRQAKQLPQAVPPPSRVSPPPPPPPVARPEGGGGDVVEDGASGIVPVNVERYWDQDSELYDVQTIQSERTTLLATEDFRQPPPKRQQVVASSVKQPPQAESLADRTAQDRNMALMMFQLRKQKQELEAKAAAHRSKQQPKQASPTTGGNLANGLQGRWRGAMRRKMVFWSPNDLTKNMLRSLFVACFFSQKNRKESLSSTPVHDPYLLYSA